MAQNTTEQTAMSDEISMQQPGEARALQGGPTETERGVQGSTPIIFPTWPTSQPGPQSTPPPAGTKPVSAIRREQVTELNYNQETGEAANLDETLTGQEMLRKRKPRL